MSQALPYQTYISEPSGLAYPISFVRGEDGSIRLAAQDLSSQTFSSRRQSFNDAETDPIIRERALSQSPVHRQSEMFSEIAPAPTFRAKSSPHDSLSRQPLYIDSAPAFRPRSNSPISLERPISPLVENALVLANTSNDANGLTAKVTQALQMGAQVYMENQKKILDVMKAMTEQMKTLDQDFEDNMDSLKDEFKKAQQALTKQFNRNTKALKEDLENNKRQLSRKMEDLSELNQESQKNYFESQQNVISHYKKIANKLF
jgi:hypothetical protein